MTPRRLAPLALLALAGAVSCGDNIHHEHGSVIVTPVIGLFTDEAGGTATFTVALTAEPSERVAITITSHNETEGSVSPRTLIFDDTNYARAQTVTITGVDDQRADGDQRYIVRVGTDLFGSFEVSVTNGDDDVPGITVSPVAGLLTSETGTTATFAVGLSSQPTYDVEVPVASSDPTEGMTSTSLLTFTPASYGPQTVTVTGVQDGISDGAVSYAIVLGVAASGDDQYNQIDVDDVSVVNTDDDVFGIVVVPTSGLQVSETGTTATFSVVLQTQPTANVSIPVMSSDTSEATVSTSSLLFTQQNWNTPHQVTITGVDDLVDDGNQAWTIVLGAAASSDPSYAGVDVGDVTGSTADDDTASITVTPTSGLMTSEAGTTDSFTVRLGSQPTAAVTIGVSSSDTSEGTVSTSALVFDSSNWSTPQTVTVTGVNDTSTDGTQSYSIVLAAATSSDPTYAGMNPTDVTATNADNDTPGFTLDQTSLVVSEFRDADSFQLSLTTPPTADVTIQISSSDTSEGTTSPMSATFTPQNWNVPQTITVTGVDDMTADGNITFSIVLAAATSADPAYNGLDAPDPQVVNLDNDTAQVYVKARNRNGVSESGQSTTFRMRLTIAPTATVTCTLFSSDTTEGTVSPTTLTFQPNNFGFQTVTITGVDDMAVDGDVMFTIITNPCSSTDLAYQGSNPRDVSAINRDND